MSDNIGTKIISAIDRAISGAKPIDPALAASNVICELALPRVQKLTEFATAKKLYAEVKRQAKVADNDLTEVAAHIAYDKQTAEHQRELAEGDLAGHPRGRSRDAWISDFASRREAAYLAIAKQGAKLKALQIVITDEILATLHDEIAELENLEARQAARFGLPYAASPTVASLRGLSDYLRNRGAVTLFNL